MILRKESLRVIFSDPLRLRRFLQSGRGLHKRFLLWAGRKLLKIPMLAPREKLKERERIVFLGNGESEEYSFWQMDKAPFGRIEKLFVVFERFPNPQGHVGIGIVDEVGNERGIHFGSWESPKELAQVQDLMAPRKGRVIVEWDGFYRLREHGGIRFEIDLEEKEKVQWDIYLRWLLENGKHLSGEDYQYDPILANVELKEYPWTYYHIRDCNCVDFVLGSLMVAFDGDERERYLENLQRSGEMESYSPYEFAMFLKKFGKDLGIVKQWESSPKKKGRYQMKWKQLRKITNR